MKQCPGRKSGVSAKLWGFSLLRERQTKVSGSLLDPGLGEEGGESAKSRKALGTESQWINMSSKFPSSPHSRPYRSA